MAADRLTVVGRAVPRLDARDKVTGAARYVSDLALPGLAHARAWRSPVPHARIIETLTERAAAAPGVLAVWPAADLPVKRLYFGPAYRDQPILAHEVIRYAGEPVVAVVADTERHAQAALALVDVRYEELPAATSAEQALAANASLIHPEIERAGHFRDLSGLRPIPGTNVCQHYAYQRGDLAHALEDADLVVEGVYRYPALSHHALEPHCVVARVGTLLARECDVVLDTGAYADIGPRVATKAGYRAPGPYRIPTLRIDAKCVYTNNVPAGAYRGYGVPQVTWAGESQMDVIAERLGLDPLALRLKNLLKRGEEYVAGDTPIDGDLAEGLEQTARAVGWTAPLARGRGRGLACALTAGGGTHSTSTAIVRINADGSVDVLAGSVEAGQGSRTALAQITAETLGVPFASVVVAAPDTSITPYDWGTSASRSTTIMGLAVQEAARDAREQVLALAAPLLDAEASMLTIRDGAITRDDRTMTVAEVISGHYGLVGGEATGVGSSVPGKSSGSLGGDRAC